MRRAYLLWAMAIVAAAATGARADNLVLNYQKSQWTGWKDNKGNNINTIGGHTTSLNFTDGTKDGRTYNIFANPNNPVYEARPADPTINYTKVFNAAFGGKYTLAFQNGFTGQNEFNVQSYSVFASNGGIVGEDVYVVYNPGKGDPALDAKGLHWIQVIWNNWALGSPPGKVDNRVDNLGDPTPYYDIRGAAGLATIDGKKVFNFYDRPGRDSTQLAAYNFAAPIRWEAEDFLVLDTGKKDKDGKEIVNVYGGIEYGWQVSMAPEPPSLVAAALGLGSMATFAVLRRLRRAG